MQTCLEAVRSLFNQISVNQLDQRGSFRRSEMQQPVCERQDRVTPTCIIHAASLHTSTWHFSLLVWRGAGVLERGGLDSRPRKRQLLAVKRQPGGTEIWEIHNRKSLWKKSEPLLLETRHHCWVVHETDITITAPSPTHQPLALEALAGGGPTSPQNWPLSRTPAWVLPT